MNEINFNIEDIEKIDLSMDVGIKKIYPPLENLTVDPTKEQQVFTHENSYGYDNVTVQPIPDEYIIPDGTLDIASNGDVDVTMFKMARVGVYTPPNLQDKSVTPTKNVQIITSDEGYDGLDQVMVNAIPNKYIVPSGTLQITENGVQDVTNYASVDVNVAGTGTASEKLYLIRNGIDQIEATGGHTFEPVDAAGGTYQEYQRDGYIELCVKQWACIGWLTSTFIDLTKYTKFYCDYSFPKAAPDTTYIDQAIVRLIVLDENDLFNCPLFSDSLLQGKNTPINRRIVGYDINTATSNRCGLFVYNISEKSYYTNFPVCIYNLWLE